MKITKMDNQVTVILNFYKRPYTLIEQLEAVYKQSISAENIIIWVNQAPNIEFPTIPDHLMLNTTIIKSTKNYGVWGRFLLGFLSESKFICILDDDTIPGKDWFKNCLESMMIKKGLYGTYGVIFKRGNNYDVEQIVGWRDPNDEIKKVDFVGHSWFFQRDWLSILWKMPPPFSKMLQCGEDMGFSYYLQKEGINTYVPPHPKNDLDKWGSSPTTGFKYGQDDAAISMKPNNVKKFDEALLGASCKLFHSVAFVTCIPGPAFSNVIL